MNDLKAATLILLQDRPGEYMILKDLEIEGKRMSGNKILVNLDKKAFSPGRYELKLVREETGCEGNSLPFQLVQHRLGQCPCLTKFEVEFI